MKIKELLKNSKLEVEKVEGLIEFVEKISESRDFDSLSKYLAEHIEPAMTSENYQKLSSSLIIGLMNLNEDKDDNKQKNGEEKMAKRNRRERAEVIEQRIKDKLKKDRKERRTNVDEQKREDGREARRARRARKARLEERRNSRRPSRRTRIEEDFRPSRKPSSRKNTDESRLERKITRLERKISKLEEGREETRRPSRRSRVTDSRRKRLSEDRRSEGRTPRRKDCDGKRKPIRKEKRKSSRRSRVSESRRPSRRSRVSESRRPLRRNTLDASLKSVGVNDEYKEILALIESKDYNFADKFNAIEAKSFEKNNVDEHKRFIRTLTRSLNKELPKEERISQVRIVEDKDNGLSKEYNEYITESTTELADTDKARVYELIESMTFDDFDNFKEQLDEMIDGYEKLDESKHTDNTTKMNATRAKFWLRDK